MVRAIRVPRYELFPRGAKKEKNSYTLEDYVRRKRTKVTRKVTKIRKSIQPGTVLIILAGKFRGRRVICLRSLASGLLLVTGPYKLNGVPLRRINQDYVIATSTKVDISGLKVDDKLNDAYFRPKKQASKKAEGEKELFAEKKREPRKIDAGRAADQKTVDTALMEIIKKTPQLSHYLKAPLP